MKPLNLYCNKPLNSNSVICWINMHWLFWFIPPASFNQTCSLVQMYQQLIGCYENPVTRLHEYFKSDNQSLWKVQLRQTSQLTGSLTSTAPPPRLRGKLMNFLWIVVDCVSPRANAQLGFNDLSLLFESMPLLHPRHTLQICCVSQCVSSPQWSLILCSSSFFLPVLTGRLWFLCPSPFG